MAMRYIQKLANSTAVQTALDNEELGKPYLVYLEDSHGIDWNSKDVTPPISAQPLTFEIISAGTIMWTANRNSWGVVPLELHFSKNGGAWETILSSSAGTPINVEAGDEIRFKGNGIADTQIADRKSSFKGSTCYFNLRGNAASMLDENNYQNLTTASKELTRLSNLFQATKVVDASRLVLPFTSFEKTQFYYAMFINCTNLVAAPDLPAATFPAGDASSDSIYSEMFRGCTSLTRAPRLNSAILGNYCYYYMFEGCSKLNYVECLATDISTGYQSLSNWLSGVSVTGTFVKHPNVTWPSGVSGIPTGWTVIDADI